MLKIAIFPYDFESISMVKYRDLLYDMEICYLLSPKGFGLQSMEADYLRRANYGYKIRENLTEDEYTEIDAIVIVDSVLKIPTNERGNCLKAVIRKNVYVISTVYDEKFNQALKELCREIDTEVLDSHAYIRNSNEITLESVGLPTERNRISVPVIAVCGIAPMTQKFDISLYYRHHLLNDGYKVSQIGTRKTANLFGFHSWNNELFDNSFSEYEKILRINQYIKDIEVSEQPDILIIGIPDAIMPYTQKHTFMFGVPAYEIFSAVSPDYAIMSLFNGEYTDDFYKEMVNVCNYRYNFDVDCFFNSCYAPVSLSINANDLSYTYARKMSMESKEYQVFNSDKLDETKMYEHMLQQLGNYGVFKAY